MKKKRHIVQTVDDTAETLVAKVNTSLRAGLRDTLKAKGDEWAPVWVRYRYGGAERYRIERMYSGDFGASAENPGMEFSLAELPAECRPLVAKLVDLLDEQAWMARVARNVAAEPVERDAKIVVTSNAGGKATAKAANRKHKELDDLILGCLERGENTRDYTKAWATEFEVSVDTVGRRINKVKAQL